jgi:ADP-dependent NAD(P)H-hydrate dehydratase / NAD(P)H-hydrate epimerase
MSSPVTCQQMQQLEAAAFATDTTPAALMQQAGEGIAQVIAKHFLRPGLAILYLGKGHNAGDALVSGLLLARLGWRLALRLAFPPSELKPLTRQHLTALEPHATLWPGDMADTLARAATVSGPVLCMAA